MKYPEGTKSITVRIPKQMDDDLEMYADKFKQTKTQLVIEAVASLLVLFKKEGK